MPPRILATVLVLAFAACAWRGRTSAPRDALASDLPATSSAQGGPADVAKPEPPKPEPPKPEPPKPEPPKPEDQRARPFAPAEIPEIDLPVTGTDILTDRTASFDPPTAVNVLPTKAAAVPKRKWDREAEFGKWIDADKDCFDARQEVLKAESQTEVKWKKKGSKCTVTSGAWDCPYTGKSFKTPTKLQIDHMVPLKNAWLSGAHRWSKEKRVEYANFLEEEDHLVAADGPANGSKSDRSPDKWLPCNEEARCWYVAAWVKVKKKWELTATAEELAALKLYRSQCKKGEIPDVPQKSCK